MAEQADSQENENPTIEEQRKIGRPLKFQSVEELDHAIGQYFQSRESYIAKTQRKVVKTDGSIFWQDDEELVPARPKTMTGLARALDCDRKTLLNYKNREEFFPSIARALSECEEYAEETLLTGKNPHGAQFSLKNNYSWIDQSEVLNKNTVVEDLDALDDPTGLTAEKEQVAGEAAKELESGDGARPPAQE
jgi:hypothetical protein